MCPTIILFIIIYYNFIIFSGCSYGKASGGPGEQVSSWLGRPSLEGQTPSPGMITGIIVRMCPTNRRGF